MKRFEVLALLSTAGMVALSGCSLKGAETVPASTASVSPGASDTPVSAVSASVTPVVEGSATPTATSAATTSSPVASSSTTTKAPAASATATASHPASSRPSAAQPAPATKGATAQGLPETFAGWMRIDVDDSLGYPSAGYSSEAGTLRLQLRPATSPKTLVTSVTKGRYVAIGSTPCATAARMNACAVTKGNRVVLISSATLETEELAGLLAQAVTVAG